MEPLDKHFTYKEHTLSGNFDTSKGRNYISTLGTSTAKTAKFISDYHEKLDKMDMKNATMYCGIVLAAALHEVVDLTSDTEMTKHSALEVMSQIVSLIHSIEETAKDTPEALMQLYQLLMFMSYNCINAIETNTLNSITCVVPVDINVTTTDIIPMPIIILLPKDDCDIAKIYDITIYNLVQEAIGSPKIPMKVNVDILIALLEHHGIL